MPAQKYEDKSHRFVTRIPETLFEKLRVKAGKEGKSINDLIVESLSDSIKYKPKKRKKKS